MLKIQDLGELQTTTSNEIPMLQFNRHILILVSCIYPGIDNDVDKHMKRICF